MSGPPPVLSGPPPVLSGPRQDHVRPANTPVAKNGQSPVGFPERGGVGKPFSKTLFRFYLPLFPPRAIRCYLLDSWETIYGVTS